MAPMAESRALKVFDKGMLHKRTHEDTLWVTLTEEYMMNGTP